MCPPFVNELIRSSLLFQRAYIMVHHSPGKSGSFVPICKPHFNIENGSMVQIGHTFLEGDM